MKHQLHCLLRLLTIMLSTHLAASITPASDSTHLKEVIFSGDALGEVWLCGGQSNMVMPVSYASDVGADLFSTPFDIRFFANGHWRKVDSSNVRDLPAVPFFFALERYRVTGKPVGIIVAAEGGTGIEAWVPTVAMLETAIGHKMRTLSNAPEVIEAARLDRAETMRPYGQHRLAQWGLGRAYPSELYQKKVLPLEGTPITGIIWYQGENHAGSHAFAAEYDAWLQGLIASWRKLFGEVPFLIVELPHYKPPTSSNELRAAQKRCADSVKATFLVPAFDLGDEHDIHPKRKRAMGKRIAQFIQKNLKN